MAPLRGICKLIQSDSGETLRIPINDDTSNTGSIIAENAEHTALDMSFTEIILGAYTYSSRLVKCSNELLQDTGIDLAAFLGQQLGERIGRAQDKVDPNHWTVFCRFLASEIPLGISLVPVTQA